MHAYWDTSALLRVYFEESASPAARECFRLYGVASSRLLLVEAAGAFRRRKDEGSLSSDGLHRVQAHLAADRQEWLLLDVDARTLERAEQITTAHPVRALDAVHISTAVVMSLGWPHPLPFLTADRRQYDAALALGLAARLLS